MVNLVILDSPVRSTLFTLDSQNRQAELQSIGEQLCRSCSEYTTFPGGVVGVERSRDQTKKVERLNGIKTSKNINLKTRNSYKNSASLTFFCFESLSDSELLLSLFMN